MILAPNGQPASNYWGPNASGRLDAGAVDSRRYWSFADRTNWQDSKHDAAFKWLRILSHMAQRYQAFFDMEQKCRDFLSDRHWTDEEKAVFAAGGRQEVTVNVSRPYAAHISGLQRLGRSRVTVDPVDGRLDPTKAEFLRQLLNHLDYKSRAPLIDSLVFDDGNSGMGCWVLVEDWSSGFCEIRIERADHRSVMFDPDSYDPLYGDCRYATRVVYLRPDTIKELFPRADLPEFTRAAFKDWSDELADPTAAGASNYMLPLQMADRVGEKYAVIEGYERGTQHVRHLIDRQTGNVLADISKVSPERIRTVLAAFPGATVLAKDIPIIRRETILPYGYVLLQEKVVKAKHFPLIGYVSMRLGQRIPESSSWNNSMVGLNRMLNVFESNKQELFLRSLRGGYWVFESGATGPGGGGQALLHQIQSGRATQSFLIKSPGHEPKPITPPDIFGWLDSLEAGQLRFFEIQTGLSAQPYAKPEAGQPGVVRRQLREESQTTAYPVIDNFNYALGIKSEAVLERQVPMLTPAYAVRISGKDGGPDQWMMLTQEMVRDVQGIGFDCHVQDGPFATEARGLEFQELVNVMDMTMKLLPEAAQAMLPRFIEGTNIRDRTEIANIVRTFLQVVNAPIEGDAAAAEAGAREMGQTAAPNAAVAQ